MNRWSDQKLEAQIEVTEKLLGRMKRVRRARAAAKASSQARDHGTRNNLIRQKHQALRGVRGAIHALSDEFRLTARQIQRIVRATAQKDRNESADRSERVAKSGVSKAMSRFRTVNSPDREPQDGEQQVTSGPRMTEQTKLAL